MHAMIFNFGRWRFAPGMWPTLAAAALIALTVSLGNWQTERAAYKRLLQARVDAGERDPVLRIGSEKVNKAQVLYRRVQAVGVFEPKHEIWLDNRIYNGVAGYHVLTPLKLAGGNTYVLVNRGWLPVGTSRNVQPHVNAITAEVKIDGYAFDPNTRYFELSNSPPQGKLWQNLNFERYAARSRLNLQPFLLQQRNDTGDGLIRDWPRPDTGVAMHVSYAMQWYGLAATLGVLWLVLNLKRKRNIDVISN